MVLNNNNNNWTRRLTASADLMETRSRARKGQPQVSTGAVLEGPAARSSTDVEEDRNPHGRQGGYCGRKRSL